MIARLCALVVLAYFAASSSHAVPILDAKTDCKQIFDEFATNLYTKQSQAGNRTAAKDLILAELRAFLLQIPSECTDYTRAFKQGFVEGFLGLNLAAVDSSGARAKRQMTWPKFDWAGMPADSTAVNSACVPGSTPGNNAQSMFMIRDRERQTMVQCTGSYFGSVMWTN